MGKNENRDAIEKIPAESSLVTEELKAQLSGIFAKMEEPVTIKSVIDPAREKDIEMAAFLKSVSSLSDKITLELYGVEEAGEKAPELNTKWLPVTGLYKNGSYARAAFHGVPGGKEINSFVLAIYNLSGPGQEVSWGLKRKIGKLKQKTNIKICVSLACHHCPGVVAACQQIAFLNPGIEAEMIDAGLYPKLVEKYQIERIPMMIFNDSEIHMGGKTMEEIVDLLK